MEDYNLYIGETLNTRLRETREFDREARCPFCNAVIHLPLTIRTEFGDVTGGNCGCGAVYTCDLTGHNMGEALLDALVLACNNDWDRVFNLSSEDYSEAVFNYNINTHRIRDIRDFRRDQGGKIIFIRIKKQN